MQLDCKYLIKLKGLSLVMRSLFTLRTALMEITKPHVENAIILMFAYVFIPPLLAAGPCLDSPVLGNLFIKGSVKWFLVFVLVGIVKMAVV